MFRAATVARHGARGFHATALRSGLLKGINPLLSADLLHLLRSAGHGDRICIVDCNFPAVEAATQTTTGKLVQLAGVDMVEACDAIASVMPLDGFVDVAVEFMAPSPGVELPPLGKEVHELSQAAIRKHSPSAAIEPLDRFAFYDAARGSFAIVQASGERRPYGNFILQKGVVGPDGKDLLP